MGMDLFVYTRDPIEDSSVFVHIRDWKKEADVWVCRSKSWQVVVCGSRGLHLVDIGAEKGELMRLRPEVRYQTEINVEGRQTNEAFVIATASAQKAAFRLHGVIHDPQQDFLIIPLSEGMLESLSGSGVKF